MNTDADIAGVLGRFDDASPELLNACELRRRVDRKYLLPKSLLKSLLALLHVDYRVVRSDGMLVAEYDTLYFDTRERQMYEDHRRGRFPRYKVRLRHHLDRQLSFLEIKSKQGLITSKARMLRVGSDSELDAEAFRFLEEHCPIPPALLVPRLSSAYRRLTLAGEATNERVTIDWGIEFHDGSRCERLPGVVIAEIKQPCYSNGSTAVRAFRTLGLREHAVSKYCLATARLAPVRTNTFKPTMRIVERLSP